MRLGVSSHLSLSLLGALKRGHPLGEFWFWAMRASTSPKMECCSTIFQSVQQNHPRNNTSPSAAPISWPLISTTMRAVSSLHAPKSANWCTCSALVSFRPIVCAGLAFRPAQECARLHCPPVFLLVMKCWIGKHQCQTPVPLHPRRLLSMGQPLTSTLPKSARHLRQCCLYQKINILFQLSRVHIVCATLRRHTHAPRSAP